MILFQADYGYLMIINKILQMYSEFPQGIA